MIKHGPFDGLLGFSQGGMLSAALLSMQMQGVALAKSCSEAQHLLFCCACEKDFFRKRGNELLELFEEPSVIRHSEGHTVLRREGKSLETMIGFIEKIEKLLLEKNSISASL